jgi:hypothetical protein
MFSFADFSALQFSRRLQGYQCTSQLLILFRSRVLLQYLCSLAIDSTNCTLPLTLVNMIGWALDIELEEPPTGRTRYVFVPSAIVPLPLEAGKPP